jgi:hypothetical protein
MLVLVSVGVLAGCPKPSTDVPGAAAKPERPPVRILAYINESSGCQEPTIELLKSFQKQYRGRVTVEIVDFGDEGKGNKRWKESGLDCMTIEIDGSPLVRFLAEGKEKVVALRQPVGFWWTHEDLQAAVAAAVDGTLQRGTEEEALAGRPPRKVDAKIVTEEVKREGKAYARVLINERSAMLIRGGSGGRSAAQRAEAAAKVLRDWTKEPVAPNQIDRQEVTGGWAVRVNKKVVAVATDADAKAAGGTPDQLAKKWLVGIRQGIAIAARLPAMGAAAPKEQPADDGCDTGG